MFRIFAEKFQKYMKIVIQRVENASVSIGGEVHSSIGAGMLVLVGVETGDTEADAPAGRKDRGPQDI